MALRSVAIWTGLAVVLALPVILAANSPLLEWRQPVYIAAGLAGVLALVLMVCQPLLAAGLVPGLERGNGRRAHRWVGLTLLCLVGVHVGTLWITSPPDVVDALLLVSPTPFSHWGVMAMWALFGAGALALLRRRTGLRPATWRLAHTGLVVISVIGTVLHALLIDGTMEALSKIAICLILVLVTAGAVLRLRAWSAMRRKRV